MGAFRNTNAGLITASDVVITDRSGTITSGGTAQVLAAAAKGRTAFQIQNTSTGDLWISEVGTAAATQPSIWVPPGAFYTSPSNGAPTSAISIFGATTGQSFSAREW
jgi:hypothetical protein